MGKIKFKIGEISRLSGFSPSGIRFLEEAGVVSPSRGKNEKYREYSLTDLQRILICRKYRECGFSLQQTVELMRNEDIKVLQTHLSTQMECIRQSLIEKQALLEFLTQQSNEIEDLQRNEGKCQMRQMPALYWLKLWQPGDSELDNTPLSLLVDWIARSPFTNSCLLLSKESVLYGEGRVQTIWGTAIEERFAKMIDFSLEAKPEYLPSHECVQTIICLNEDLTISASDLERVRVFIRQNHYEVIGRAVSRFFYSIVTDDKLERFDHLWIPIKKALK